MEWLYAVLGITTALLALLWYKKKTSQSLPEVIIYGPSGSGKTKLFYLVFSNQITEKNDLNTLASLKPNTSQLSINNTQIRITDYPGHKYYYSQLLNTLPHCLGMIFMIDSTDKQSFKKAAEELYELMSLKQPKEILIFCNKQDQQFAKKILMIESELSTEIERLKVVKENDIGDVKREKVGKAGMRFEFSHMSEFGIKVEFAEGSLKWNIDEIQQFIQRVVKSR